VRTATEIDEAHVPVARVAVHGDDLALGPLLLERVGSLGHALDDLGLVGLIREQLQSRCTIEFLALEVLVLGNDAQHLRLDALEVVGRERPFDVEVVVEAVLDRWSDRILGARVQREHRLSEDVRRGVACDLATEILVLSDDADLAAVRGDVGKVTLPAVYGQGDRSTRRRRAREREPVAAAVASDRRHREPMLSAHRRSKRGSPTPIVAPSARSR
jgi:hypothetical protein